MVNNIGNSRSNSPSTPFSSEQTTKKEAINFSNRFAYALRFLGIQSNQTQPGQGRPTMGPSHDGEGIPAKGINTLTIDEIETIIAEFMQTKWKLKEAINFSNWVAYALRFLGIQSNQTLPGQGCPTIPIDEIHTIAELMQTKANMPHIIITEEGPWELNDPDLPIELSLGTIKELLADRDQNDLVLIYTKTLFYTDSKKREMQLRNLLSPDDLACLKFAKSSNHTPHNGAKLPQETPPINQAAPILPHELSSNTQVVNQVLALFREITNRTNQRTPSYPFDVYALMKKITHLITNNNKSEEYKIREAVSAQLSLTDMLAIATAMPIAPKSNGVGGYVMITDQGPVRLDNKNILYGDVVARMINQLLENQSVEVQALLYRATPFYTDHKERANAISKHLGGTYAPPNSPVRPIIDSTPNNITELL